MFVVLVAAYALVLFIMFFTAGVDNVNSLRLAAAFLLILAAAAFAALLFSGSVAGYSEDVGELPESPLDVETQDGEAAEDERTPLPGECPNCGRLNPAGSNFCNACGTQLSAD